MVEWYISTPYGTGTLTLDEHDRITATPPIWRTWRGQQFSAFIAYQLEVVADSAVRMARIEDR